MGKTKSSNRSPVENTSPRPDYLAPPVNEVLLSLQFQPIPGLETLQFGRLWDIFRQSYPRTDVKPPIPPVKEKFESKEPIRHQFRIVSEPMVPRCWFENESGTELIQVQQDRFIFNWKQTEEEEAYPRYEQVRAKFRRHFRKFKKFLKDNEIGRVIADQCEVTYVNILPPGKGWVRFGQVKEIVAPWSGRFSDEFLAEPEDINLKTRFVLLDEQGAPKGRLFMSFDPAFQESSGQLVYKYELTVRGAPADNKETSILDFFDFGRENIVRGFASFTSKKMGQIWERTDA